MIIKCKMCGGDLHPAENASTCECEFCGTVQTIPRLDNDRRANLYDRANHFRRQNEFDKAAGIYEQILQEDRTDAEAYWSLVLCRYGIEYVEDPGTKKRVPTVNRTQMISIFADEDYKSALEFADAGQKSIYEQEAAAIDTIQKGILDISKREKPFDVFICYKETDAQGKRTPDSVLANELYHQLTREGFKVFFSRITLEDKLGQQYEPYIFAALNSAKVMVVLGTRPEYFNSAWVKNEWSRYLTLIRSGANKTLVPAYKDMDPYDLPEEFSHLQALDMGKLGFMPDLIHGIKKLTRSEKPVESQPVVIQQAASRDGSNAAALLDRAFMALEDGEWEKADEFCEKALNIDARNPRAYMGKLMAERRVRKTDDLSEQEQTLDQSGNYNKALRFADEELKARLEEYNQKIVDRREQRRMQAQFNDIMAALNQARSISEVQELRRRLQGISGYKDIEIGMKACEEKTEEINSSGYDMARGMMAKGDFAVAGKIFRALGHYRDSQTQARRCADLEKERAAKAAEEEQKRKKLAAEQAAKEEAERQEKMRIEAELNKRREEINRRKAEEKAAKTRKIAIVAGIAVALCIAGFFLFTKVIQPAIAYNQAVSAMKNGQYDKAIAAFTGLGDYKDSSVRLWQTFANEAFDHEQYDAVGDIYASLPEEYQDHKEDFVSMYNEGMTLMENGKYDEANAVFLKLGKYSDSREKASEALYRKASSLTAAGKREEATAIYEALNGYSDSETRILQIKADALYDSQNYAGAWNIYSTLDETYQTHKTDYQNKYEEAESLLEEGKYDEAASVFTKLGDYSDAATKVQECAYQKAKMLASSGKYDEAISFFEGLKGYSDSESLAEKAKADKLYDSGQYGQAYSIYVTLEEEYQSHAKDYEAMYNNAETLQKDGKYDESVDAFTMLGSYKDSSTQIEHSKYLKAGTLAAEGKYDDAIELYNSLIDYSDSESLAAQARADKLYDSEQYGQAYSIYATLEEKYQSHTKDYETMYNNAEALQKEGKYDEAVDAFAALGSYKDSITQIDYNKYLKAGALAGEGKYDEAIAIYNSINYYDSEILSQKAKADQLYDEGKAAEAYEIYSILDDSYQTHAQDYQAAYETATEKLTAGDYDGAYESFVALGTYRDSKAKADQCGKDKADALFAAEKYSEAAEVYTDIGDSENAKRSVYLYAGQLATNEEFRKAADLYGTIIDYEDSRDQRYQTGLQAREKGNLEDAYSILSEDPDYREAREAIYQTGLSASEKKLYEVSVPAFKLVGAYKDAAMKLTMDTYAWGCQLYEKAEYDLSEEVFRSMGDFSDAPAQADQAAYAAAVVQMEAEEYENARNRFLAIKEYSDSANKAKECEYLLGKRFFAEGDYTQAKSIFASLADYVDSKRMVKECGYVQAKALYDQQDWLNAINAFKAENLQGYKDTYTLMNECRLQIATYQMRYGSYENALTWLENAGEYKNCPELAAECRRQLALMDAKALEEAGDYEGAYAEYINGNDSEKSNEMAYQAGMKKITDGDYENAVDWFEKAGEYGDAKEQIFEIGEYYYTTQQYDLAETIYAKVQPAETATRRLYELGQYYELAGNGERAVQAYREAADYKNAEERENALVYEIAEALYSLEEYETAKELYLIIPGYAEADIRLRKAKTTPFKKVGSIVKFGRYEQDNNMENGTEEIEWIVLDVQEGKSLLLSKQLLDAKPYHGELSDVTWENCTLRSWLNQVFLKTAFTEEEQAAILLTTVDNSQSQGYSVYGTNGGNNTQDYVFLLSYYEAFDLYFSGNEMRRCSPTDYATAQGALVSTYIKTDGKGTGWWWLRSPGYDQNGAARVRNDGSRSSINVFSDSGCIRPALWLNLESEIF